MRSIQTRFSFLSTCVHAPIHFIIFTHQTNGPRNCPGAMKDEQQANVVRYQQSYVEIPIGTRRPLRLKQKLNWIYCLFVFGFCMKSFRVLCQFASGRDIRLHDHLQVSQHDGKLIATKNVLLFVFIIITATILSLLVIWISVERFLTYDSVFESKDSFPNDEYYIWCIFKIGKL